MLILDRKPHTIEDLDWILEEAKRNGIHTDNHKRQFYNIVCAFDIETTSFNDDIPEEYTDHDVYEYLKGIKIRITQQAFSDIPDLPLIRRSLFGQLYLSKTEGVAVDVLYKELTNIFPYYFNEEDTPNTSDQLDRILTIFLSQKPRHERPDDTKRSIMYIWQLGINGHVIIGRTNEELVYTFNYIAEYLELNAEDRRLICLVHNLSMEFQYIRKLFEWSKVFSIDTRKPVYAINSNGIEFRCSYILTNMSLAKVAENLTTPEYADLKKLVGDLDYSKPRHTKTVITDKELDYCMNDVLILNAFQYEQLQREKKMFNIPLTCTGYARRFCRKNCLYGNEWKTWRKQFNKYHTLMKSLQITDLAEYEQLKRAFQGGFTHATNYWSGYTVNNVDSIDFTSSYPFVLLSEQFPMSTGKIVKPETPEELENYLTKYCCLFDVRFYDLQPVLEYENYISASKCFQKINAIENNGRIYSADMISTTITEVDLKIIDKTYTYSRKEIANFRIYKKGYLPKELITSIIKLYSDKTTLKGVKGKEQEYLVSKGLLNSVYGMMVTDFIRDEILYTTDWCPKPDLSPEEQKKINEQQLNKYNNSRRRFLFFPWGIWCTCFARRNLFLGITEFCNMDNGLDGCDLLYEDTDSLKVINIDRHREFIDKYNRLCEFKLKKMCEHYNIDYNDLLPKTIKGVIKPLGVWDNDGYYDKFKTLGAKRYMVLENGELNITVSGVNKKVAVPWLVKKYGLDGAFDHFNDGLEIDAAYTGKLTHYYIDDYHEGVLTDYNGIECKYEAPSGVYFEPASYKFDISVKYIEFLKGLFYTK